MSSSFITRVDHEKDEPYTVIFQTDDPCKYSYIENECRRMIGHSKPTENPAEREPANGYGVMAARMLE